MNIKLIEFNEKLKHYLHEFSTCLIKSRLFSNLSCPIPPSPLNPLLHMVRHLADWVAPLPHSLHPLPSNSSLFPLPLLPKNHKLQKLKILLSKIFSFKLENCFCIHFRTMHIIWERKGSA